MYMTKPRQMMRINYVIALFELKTFKLRNGVQFQMELFDRFSMSVDSIEAVQVVQFKKISGKHIIRCQKGITVLLFIFFSQCIA